MARPSRLVEGFSFKGTARRRVDGLHSDVARARRRWTKEGRFQSCVPLRSAAARSSRCVLLSLQAPQRPQSVESKKTSRGRKGLSKSNNSVRKEVLHILLRIEGDGSFASLATGVPKTGDRDEVSSRDKRDVTRLLSDVLRWKRRLDFIIDELQGQHLQAASSKGKGGKKKVKPFDSIVRQILRMGAYELYFLRKPAYVVSEYVDLAKTSKDARGAAGLINSLLRKVSVMDTEEEKARPELEGMGHKELVRHLGTFHSHPDWLVDRWLKQFGLSSCLELLRYNNVRPQYCIRTNPCNGLSVSEMKEKLNEIADVQYRESKLLEDFIVVEKGLQNVFSLGLIQDGRCSVQDVSAGLVVHLMDPKPGERVLDVCAAPGGKFYYAASRMGYEGKLVALDASRNRMKALEKGTRNFPETLAIETYSQTFEEWSEQNSGMDFDKVLVDAPCSGSGVLAKRADLRWRRTEQDLSEMIEIQARLLDHAKNHVKVGGCLLYSTCSIDREENSMQVQKFLSENKNFRLEENSVQVLEDSVRLDGFLQTFPQEHGIDGAFAARLTRIA